MHTDQYARRNHSRIEKNIHTRKTINTTEEYYEIKIFGLLDGI